jgi:hypothetical protein
MLVAMTWTLHACRDRLTLIAVSEVLLYKNYIFGGNG